MCPARQSLHHNNFTCTKDPCADCEQGCEQESDSFVCKCEKGYRLAKDSKSCLDVNECKEEDPCTGHLMTVRSSVSHDILSILLGNFTGRFWIGLHLGTDCPEAAAGLKGFQWVTEDSESDFFNWAPSFDSSCSSPRCVSVSKESDFKWTQEPCGEQAVGFLCEYDLIQPCKNLEVPQGESTKYVCFSEKWLKCFSAPCEHDCHNTPGSYNCSCFEGYKVDPKSPNKCKLHCGREECAAECDPNDASQCYCPDGYVAEEREDHTVCIEIDECISNFCDQHCTNTFGSYVCSCSPGYTLVNQYNCVKNEDHTDGSQDSTTAPDFPTSSYIPGPTRQPSGVSVGAFVGIILCTVFLIVLVVFLAHHILSRRGKMESSGALKAQEGEAHGLHRVATDA
uniref:Thrombomodulin n=1 Tax=Seriola dumerili TaxID=41447 RepID=A0A3B4TZ48_SERDU